MNIIWQLVPDQMYNKTTEDSSYKDYSEMFQVWYVESGTSK